jgi:hypothetical protein
MWASKLEKVLKHIWYVRAHGQTDVCFAIEFKVFYGNQQVAKNRFAEGQ